MSVIGIDTSSDSLPVAGQPVRRRWRGRAASAGKASGAARLIMTEADLATCRDGEVLVMRHATPAVLPALTGAAAAVCETGGVLNHLAVVARELGKPCVTGLPGILAQVTTGEPLHVDGVAGVVECSDCSGSVRAPAAASAAPVTGEHMTPLVQFGHFSGAFECVEASFDLEAAVRTAALVALPVALELGEGFEFDIEGNTILVSRAQLRQTTDRLVDRIEARTSIARRWRATYDDICVWPGWEGALRVSADADLLVALRRFVVLNQLTWAAALAKEPLSVRLRAFLRAQVKGVEADRVEQLFLASLITNGQSYILTAGGAIPPSRDIPTSPGVTSTLRALLDEDACERALAYIAALADLVSLTERKNTDLTRCAAAIRHAPVARVLGLTQGEVVDDGTAQRRRRLVTRVLTAMSAHSTGGALT